MAGALGLASLSRQDGVSDPRKGAPADMEPFLADLGSMAAEEGVRQSPLLGG
jgi:hypothetical protein